MDFLQLPPVIMSLIALFSAGLTLVFFVRYNDLRSLRSANTDLRQLIEDKDKIVEEFRKEINDLKKHISYLEGSLQARDDRISALERIQVVQTINPDMVSYMAEMRSFTQDVKNYMSETHAALMSTIQPKRRGDE